jgi:hypothetical protein
MEPNPIRKIAETTSAGARFCAASCKSAWDKIVRRFAALPVKALAQRVIELFRGKTEKKEAGDGKWTRKVDFDMMPFLPDGPRPVGPLPSDPQPAYRPIPNDFMTVIVAGQRSHLPFRTDEGTTSLKAVFDSRPATVSVPRVPANDALPVFKIA